MYDTNKNGLLEDKEIRNYLVEAIHVNKRLTKRDVNNFIMGFDQNGDGKISKT
jgi:Ca2+-binding EF-hand superfamily protein